MAENRTYRMTLSEFHRYLDDKRRELEACYREIEEVQFQFNEIFRLELAAWQEQISYCFPRVATQRQEMPPDFARHIDQVESEEQTRIRQEIAELDREIRDGRARVDELLGEAQAATDALRVANPEINDREEHLKALVVEYQDEYAQAFEELETLDTFPLGWLTNYAKIRQLNKAQSTAKKKQGEAMQQLREVRQDWLARVEGTSDTQSELRGEWQKLTVRIAEAQGRRDHLEAHLETLAEQAALQRVLEELREAPDVSGELGEALRALVGRNEVRWGYEKGLQAVAEALGLVKGLGEGLKRFARSVQTVLQEQRRYGLKQVHVPVPGSVAAINQIWGNLAKRVKDEKYMGTHPAEFSSVVDEYIKQRLTDQSIQTFFEEMGQALNQATSAWG